MTDFTEQELGVDLTRDMKEATDRLDDLWYQRRHVWLDAYTHGAFYADIAEANGVDEVQVYRSLAKAREECQRFMFDECAEGRHDDCPGYEPGEPPELCIDECHQRRRRGKRRAKGDSADK